MKILDILFRDTPWSHEGVMLTFTWQDVDSLAEVGPDQGQAWCGKGLGGVEMAGR